MQPELKGVERFDSAVVEARSTLGARELASIAWFIRRAVEMKRRTGLNPHVVTGIGNEDFPMLLAGPRAVRIGRGWRRRWRS